jgi:hypothetical protein
MVLQPLNQKANMKRDTINLKGTLQNEQATLAQIKASGVAILETLRSGYLLTMDHQCYQHWWVEYTPGNFIKTIN